MPSDTLLSDLVPLQEPGIARSELQQHVRLLSKLSTPIHAVSCLLASHEQTMEHHLRQLRSDAAGDSNDFEIIGAVSQRVFGTIKLVLLQHIVLQHIVPSLLADLPLIRT
jgi:hypothetical protein